MDDTQTFPFPEVPQSLADRRALFERHGPPDPFDAAYKVAWGLTVDDGVAMKPKEVEAFLGLLEADGRRMAGRGAARLMRDRPDLDDEVAVSLDSVLHPDRWLRDEAALKELTEDMS